MGIDSLFKNYQKKIGTYDKRQWEKTIERRILDGLTNVQMRSTKPNTDLIDLDLVRGSSFTKAKPKHGFLTVAKLATSRYMLLPFYAHWWIQETSQVVFAGTLLLYTSQVANILIYCCQSYKNTHFTQNICLSEISVPVLMMWVLSFIHSQIVSTNSDSEQCALKMSKTKRYRKRRPMVKHVRMDPFSADSTTQMRSKGRKKRLAWDMNLMFSPEKSSKDPNISEQKMCDSEHEYSPIVCGETTTTIADFEKIQPQAHHSYFLKARSQLKSNNEKCNAWVNNLQKQNPSGELSRQRIKRREENYSTDSESEAEVSMTLLKRKSVLLHQKKHVPRINVIHITDSDTGDEGETLSSPETAGSCRLSSGITHSVSEWMGVTTNSEDCSCNSDLEAMSDTYLESTHDHMVAAAILTPPSAKVSCTIWDGREVKKAQLSVLEISSSIIAKVESMPNTKDYFYFGLMISTCYAFFPLICRFLNNYVATRDPTELRLDILQIVNVSYSQLINHLTHTVTVCFGSSKWEHLVSVNLLFQRWVLTCAFFFLLSVAERTFKQRFLYAKLFSHLTSSQRARTSGLPHFRLNKVRNIKTWLSVRSYLKKRGPQRSVDVIVSTAFVTTLLLVAFLCIELLKDTVAMNSRYNIEALILCLGLGILLLRFMTLGTKINKKYRNLSVLITEQINLHLQIEQKPHKKDELTLANNVLKLAIDLLKELDNPFKISGLSANPILYNVTRVMILSALSGILSEMFGFKLKLHKIKLK